MATQRIYTPEEAVQHLHQLPPDAQKMIYSKEMGEILTQIGEKNNLHLDQLGDLESETVAFMLGFTEPKDFIHILGETLRVSPKAADDITNDINTLLLKKEREVMRIAIPDQHPQILSAEIPKKEPQQMPTSANEPPMSILPSNIKPIFSGPTLQKPTQKEPAPSENKEKGAPPKYKIDPYREPIE